MKDGFPSPSPTVAIGAALLSLLLAGSHVALQVGSFGPAPVAKRLAEIALGRGPLKRFNQTGNIAIYDYEGSISPMFKVSWEVHGLLQGMWVLRLTDIALLRPEGLGELKYVFTSDTRRQWNVIMNGPLEGNIYGVAFDRPNEAHIWSWSWACRDLKDRDLPDYLVRAPEEVCRIASKGKPYDTSKGKGDD